VTFTSRRATKVVAALSLCVLALQAVKRIVGYFHGPAVFYIDQIFNSVFLVVLPSIVLVVNIILLREVRRASHNAAANLGLQQHHPPTSSNADVPTVMLISTSLVHVSVIAPGFIVDVFLDVIPYSVWCDESWTRTLHVAEQLKLVGDGLYHVVFAYNFFVYVITWKQFRCELRQLCFFFIH